MADSLTFSGEQGIGAAPVPRPPQPISATFSSSLACGVGRPCDTQSAGQGQSAPRPCSA